MSLIPTNSPKFMDLVNKVDDFRTDFHVIKKEVDDLSDGEVLNRLNELDEDIERFNKRLKRDYRSSVFQERIDELAYLRGQVVKFRTGILLVKSYNLVVKKLISPSTKFLVKWFLRDGK